MREDGKIDLLDRLELVDIARHKPAAAIIYIVHMQSCLPGKQMQLYLGR